MPRYRSADTLLTALFTILVAAFIALIAWVLLHPDTDDDTPPRCHAIHTAHADIVRGGPRPCLLTHTGRATRPTYATPEHPGADHAPPKPSTTTPGQKPKAPAGPKPPKAPTAPKAPAGPKPPKAPAAPRVR
ncbi:hypothetical protein ACH4UR_37635 [Streptomyces lydicus]|uniref:hypothetical protein n=1 Tax=Streptomyces lydicus TaxID=47763 RepID=UPI003411770E